MAIIRCKMCGGELNITEGASVAECEYCGSKQTLPKLDDQQRAAAFDRGNHFRRLGEFDKALTVYEHIVQEDENDAEAHWCCALCRFGIEYVKDPATGAYLPTCHRASFDNFLEDVDYQAALTHADSVARRQYESDGEQIAAVQRGILITVQKEEPFDVFICYKETDENGVRTIDSTLAQDIYYQLTEQGCRVFFARITLEDKAGREYEPYIFAALHSAKVMVVVGTKPEYLNAVWVKNEWSRYLALMKQDRKRLLIPCYRDMDPYDLPEQLSVLQSYDMGKISFIRELTRDIAKVLDADKRQEVKKAAALHSESGVNLSALIKRGNMALEDGDWDRADGFFEQVLNMDAECAEAYLGKALVAQKCGSLQALVDQLKKIPPKHETLTGVRQGDPRLDAIAERYGDRFDLGKDAILSEIQKNPDNCTYSSAVSGWQQLQKNVDAYFTQDKLMGRAVRFARGDLAGRLASARGEIQAALNDALAKARQEDEESVRQLWARAETTAAQLRQTAQERQEAGGVAVKEEHAGAARRFETQKSDQDSVARAETGRAEGERLRQNTQTEDERRQQKTQAAVYHRLEAQSKAKRLKAMLAIAAVLAVGMCFLFAKIIIPGNRYRDAEALLAEGDFDSAVAIFTELDGFKDSEDRILEARYDEAKALLDKGDMAGAAMAYGSLGDYRLSRERSMALWDKIAVRNTIAVGDSHTVGLRSDGTVVVVGLNYTGQCDVDDWQNIVAVAASFGHTVGLRSDGTVVAVGNNDDGQCDVDDWQDIVAIAADGNNTVGLRSDGTVVATGDSKDNVDDWRDIVAIAVGDFHTVGLRSDGTVVAVGNNDDGQCDVDDWQDIVAIAAGEDITIGLRSDGTVAAAGSGFFYDCDVDDWQDIVAVAINWHHTVGLRTDGTVVEVGDEIILDQCNVRDWQDIVAIAADGNNTVGLRSDGTVVAETGSSALNARLNGWTNIKLPE